MSSVALIASNELTTAQRASRAHQEALSATKQAIMEVLTKTSELHDDLESLAELKSIPAPILDCIARLAGEIDSRINTIATLTSRSFPG
jgi:hypothetical protein